MCLIATWILCGLQYDMSACKNKKWLYLFATWHVCVCNQYPLWVATWRVSLQKTMVCTCELLWLQHGRVCDCYMRDCGLQQEKRCVLATSAVSVWFAPWTDSWLQLLVSRDCNMGKNFIYCIRFATYTARRLKKSENEPIAKLLRLCGSNVIYTFYIVLCCCVS
jgi:hypothetical protein